MRPSSLPVYKFPAAIGADADASVFAALAAVLVAAEREYGAGNAGPTVRAALTIGALHATEIRAAARRAVRRFPDLSAVVNRLPSILEVGRRLAAASLRDEG